MPTSIPQSVKYTEDTNLLNELETLYSYILDDMNLNAAEPTLANIGFFNHSGKVFIDPQKVGRTRIFMTRPNMNFRNEGNVEKCRILNYAIANKLGTTVSRFLMYPQIVENIAYGGLFLKNNYGHNVLTYRTMGSLVGTAWDGRVGPFGTPAWTEDAKIEGQLNKNNANYENNIEKDGYSYVIDKTPFIPLVTNLCTECSGGKDIILETEQTDQNFSGNSLVYGSGINESRGPGEISLTFEDIYGSPIFYMILLWVYYIHYVAKGICVPELNYVTNRIIDYTCSIYVFMLDTDQETIVRATRYTGAFPKSIPFANIMHSRDIDIQSLSKLTIPFQYNFACPMDPILFREFNMISESALVDRSGSGHISTEYGITNTNRIKNAANFFYGKSHVISKKEALYFRNTWLPDKVPGKLYNPKLDIARATDMTPYTGYDGLDANKIFGDTSDIDKSQQQYLAGKEAFYNSQLGLYKGNLGDVYNNRMPYVVDGNRLMYL